MHRKKDPDPVVSIRHTDKIWTVENFISPARCAALIAFSEKRGYREATVSLAQGAKMMKGLRDNYRVNFQDRGLAVRLYEKLSLHLPTLDTTSAPTGLSENFRFYRYDKNQRFKRHIDGRVRSGEQESRLTFMIYLNDNYDGGETKFNDALIAPKQGRALLFIHEQKHESLPILDGRKYVLRSDVFYASRNIGPARDG